MRQEKASSFLECDNGDQQLYLWCWKKARFIWSLSRGQYWAMHRAGAGLGGQWEPQYPLRAGVQAVPPYPSLKPCSSLHKSLFFLPASAAAAGSSKHFPCMGFFPPPPRSIHDACFPSLPLPGTEWTLSIFKGVSAESLLWVQAESLHMYKVRLPVASWPGPPSNSGSLLREPAHPLFQPSWSCLNVRFES